MMTKNESWKVLKLKYLKVIYGLHVRGFGGYDDDRGLYINTYNMMVRAINTLPDCPDIFIKCAMNEAIKKDCKMLDGIIKRFKGV